MNQNIIKYKRLERFLNKIEFNEITTGGLLAHAFELNYYHETKLSYLKYLLVFLKYSLTLPFSKSLRHTSGEYLLTKLDNRFHFNELMDPLIIHYLDLSIIISNEKSFDPKISEAYPVYSNFINTKHTVINNKKDAFQIIYTTLKVLFSLIKFKKRLQISFNELIQYTLNSLIQFRKSSFWENYFNKCIIKPRCVITEFDRNSIVSPMILNARKHNIMTITLTHGVVLDYGIVPILADYIFCWGQFQKKHLIKLGVSSDRISITGNPMIKCFNKSVGKKSFTGNALKVCLAISPESDSVNNSLIQPFISAIDQYNDIKGIIKLHPSLKKENYKCIFSGSDKIRIYESSEITNEELFKVMDILIVHFSGIANEALAVGVPVIVMEPSGLSHLDFFQKELYQNAGCKVAVNSNDLIEIFNEYKTDPDLFRMKSIQKCEHYLRDMFDTTGEDSVRAMISEIDRLSENGRDESIMS